jgi:hypothetical protein
MAGVPTTIAHAKFHSITPKKIFFTLSKRERIRQA